MLETGAYRIIRRHLAIESAVFPRGFPASGSAARAPAGPRRQPPETESPRCTLVPARTPAHPRGAAPAAAAAKWNDERVRVGARTCGHTAVSAARRAAGTARAPCAVRALLIIPDFTSKRAHILGF